MRKTILFLTLLFLAGCYKQPPPEVKVGPAGSDNDSPIIISDTTTQRPDQSKPGTTPTVTPGTNISHKNRESNGHWHKDTGQKTNNVHDTDAHDTYRPACLEFSHPSKHIVPIDAAKPWHIVFDNTSGKAFSMTWDVKTRDVVIDQDGFSDPGGGTEIDGAMQVTQIKGMVDTLPVSGGVALTPPPAKRPLVTVHYCPNGQCVDENSKDKCAK